MRAAEKDLPVKSMLAKLTCDSAKIEVGGHNLITLAHRGTYLVCKMSTIRVVGYCSINANKGT